MEQLIIEFKNAEDKAMLQRVIAALQMDVILSENENVIPQLHYEKLKTISDEMDLNSELGTTWEELKRKVYSSNE